MTQTNNSQAGPKTALLLTGGGARAAYQVGVLKALAQQYPRNSKIPFQIICGTSAGAINGTALACYASCFHLGVKKLEWVWKNFNTSQVYYSDYLRSTWHLIRGVLSAFQADYANNRPVSMLDNRPLKHLLSAMLDLKRLDRNLMGGYLDSVSVTASCYNTGESITFFQSKAAQEWQRSRRRGVSTLLGVHHLMASAAIPLVMPSVRINQQYFGDGSVNQLAPLSAPIHLGADRILILGLEQPRQRQVQQQVHHHPNLATVAGHLLDSIFSDTLNADMERMQRVNKTLHTLQQHGITSDLKPVHSYLLNPGTQFNQLASEHYLSLPMAIRTLLRTVGIKQHSDSSLVSYLLFEKSFTRRLIDLGYQEAMAQMPALLAFLNNDSPNPATDCRQ